MDHGTQARYPARAASRAPRFLARTIAAMRPAPTVFVSASAIGYYGDRADDSVDESAPPGGGFLAQVAREWEDAAGPARDAGIRIVHPRFGVVLGPGGGALAKLVPVFEIGAGGKIGDGKQWMSWIARTGCRPRALLLGSWRTPCTVPPTSLPQTR